MTTTRDTDSVQRITLIGEYRYYRANQGASGHGVPPMRTVAGYCLQYPAPLEILANIKLPVQVDQTAVRKLIEGAA